MAQAASTALSPRRRACERVVPFLDGSPGRLVRRRPAQPPPGAARPKNTRRAHAGHPKQPEAHDGSKGRIGSVHTNTHGELGRRAWDRAIRAAQAVKSAKAALIRRQPAAYARPDAAEVWHPDKLVDRTCLPTAGAIFAS
jgi:hypothetical protein